MLSPYPPLPPPSPWSPTQQDQIASVAARNDDIQPSVAVAPVSPENPSVEPGTGWLAAAIMMVGVLTLIGLSVMRNNHRMVDEGQEMSSVGDASSKLSATNRRKDRSNLTLGELSRRARSRGVPSEEIEAALESDEPRAALLALITDARRRRSGHRGGRLLGASRLGPPYGRGHGAGSEADGARDDDGDEDEEEEERNVRRGSAETG